MDQQEPEDRGPDTEPETEQNTGRRFFSRAERFVLQAAAGGRCEECGADLAAGFHADHRRPFAAGGATSLDNAQALCPQCNQRKGARLVQDIGDATGAALAQEPARPLQGPPSAPPVAPWTLPLRPWQRQGVRVWRRLREQGRSNMTVTATPGSGKTALALFLAGEEFRQGRADLLVVVVPTRTLKTQWAQAAHRAGLHLTAGWGNASVAPPADTHGCLVTYAQVASLPEALQLLCARRRVVAVLDEVHHCATSLAWGDALHQALEHAQSRLCLSGTAWRTDGAAIPFVTASAQGDALSDVSYTYAQALEEGVLREAYFFALEASVLWLDENGERTATFADALNERDGARRLRAALDAQGDWLRAMLSRADAALTVVRPGHRQAKGLAVAMDTVHARAVASLLQAVTGEAPLLALSDDPLSQATLERFRSGPCRWLVVCRMAGEGYDLPDIRIVAWATNVTSEVAFRQIVARALRVVPGLLHQDAQVFLPADPRLVAMAQNLLGAGGLRARLGEAFGLAEDEEAGGLEPGEGDRIGGSVFVPLELRAMGQRVVTGGALVTASALDRARAMQAASAGLSGVPEHWLAAELSRMAAEPAGLMGEEEPGSGGERGADAGSGGSGTPPSLPPPSLATPFGITSSRVGVETREAAREHADEDLLPDEAQTYDRRRQTLRRVCTRLTALIARELDVNASVVHRAFHRSLGVRQAEATLAQLEQRKRLLEDKLRELRAV